jgi:hypothetical protein
LTSTYVTAGKSRALDTYLLQHLSMSGLGWQASNIAVVSGAIDARSAPAVPAKIVSTGSIAREQMLPQSKALFTGVQLSSVERKTPPLKYVPAKMCLLELVGNAQTSTWMMS